MSGESPTELAITLDVDWAPDWAIDATAAILREHGVKATWFLTHASDAVDRLREEPDLFELGIHPNFLPGSTHGSTPGRVLDHMFEVAPQATSMRAHGLAMSSPLLHKIAEETTITTDLSTFLPYMGGIEPVLYSWRGASIVRLPYFWEDDHEMELEPPRWEAEHLLAAGPGLRVMNFHPVHVYLNSRSMDAYQSLGPLADATEDAASAAAESGPGTRTVLEQLSESLAGEDTWRIRDLRERFPSRWPSRRQHDP